jgi:hypothetical protein
MEQAGDKCPTCGEILRETEGNCEGKRKRGEAQERFLACRCLHAGDYSCNCGNPCWSLF